jgi:hypothetical protein
MNERSDVEETASSGFRTGPKDRGKGTPGLASKHVSPMCRRSHLDSYLASDLEKDEWMLKRVPSQLHALLLPP